MAESKLFSCTVVTPEKVVLECQARFVAVPAHDGEIGFLRARAPLVVKLDVGRMRVESEDQTTVLFVDRGFAEMNRDGLTILTEEALDLEALDADRARAEIEKAQEAPSTGEDDHEARQHALRRARVQLRMLGR